MFKDGTKEEILNELHRSPQTIAQYAKNHDLSQPTVHRHMSGLLRHGLIREAETSEKGYVAERYYQPNFPVITKDDQALFEESILALARELAGTITRSLPHLKEAFERSDATRKGWKFEEIAQYLVFTAQREARKKLEAENILATQLKSAGLDFLFWATE
jgi:DNA-binding transcriptional ArsR family regulator